MKMNGITWFDIGYGLYLVCLIGGQLFLFLKGLQIYYQKRQDKETIPYEKGGPRPKIPKCQKRET